MKPSTMSLFEQEMHDQVAAARDAVEAAKGRNDPLLLQAAEAHLESLVDLARRNGVIVDGTESAVAAEPTGGLIAEPTPLAAPAV